MTLDPDQTRRAGTTMKPAGKPASNTEQPNNASCLYPPTITPPDAPLPILKFIRTFPRNPLLAMPKAAYHDDIFVYRFRKFVYVWVTGPAMVEQTLVKHAGDLSKTPQEKRILGGLVGDSVLTADHDTWRWQRRALARLFRHSELLNHVPAMVQATDTLTSRWRAAGSCISAIDTDMTNVTFDVIMNTLLTGSEISEAETIIGAGQRYLSKAPWELVYTILQLPRWLPHPGTWTLRQSARELRAAVGAIVDRRTNGLANVSDRNDDKDHALTTDMLGRLIAAQDPETGRPMDREQIINNLLTLLEAGHETTAKALTWTLYLLARSPDWQHRVRDEIRTVTSGNPIAPSHIDQLVVTTRVLKEAMRLYPPAPVIARAVENPITLGVHRFDRGTQLIMPLFCIHRHRKYWADPDRFDPDRFLPENEMGRPRTQYMPFGAGPRICIGQSFAMIEAVTLLATFLRDFEFIWDGQHKPEPVSRITLHPSGGMPLGVRTVR
ncbi:MAG: cytochrome P450 [Pseudomonadota bacterium]